MSGKYQRENLLTRLAASWLGLGLTFSECEPVSVVRRPGTGTGQGRRMTESDSSCPSCGLQVYQAEAVPVGNKNILY